MKVRLLTAIGLLSAHSVLCQTSATFDPFPPGSAGRYHFDLSRNFFATPAIEAAARAELMQRLQRLSTVAATATRSSAALLQAFELEDSVQRQVGKHLAYWSLRSLTNTADQLAGRMVNEFGVAAAPAYNALGLAIAATPRERIDSLRRSNAALEKYAYSIEQTYQATRGQPTAEAAAAINTLSPQIQNWGPALFQTTRAALEPVIVQTPDGVLDSRRDMNAIRSSPDRTVREKFFKENNEAIARRRGTFAFILTRSAEGRNALATLQGFSNYPDQTYYNRSLTRDDVVKFLDRIASHSEVNRAYETLRREHLKKMLGYSEVHQWDLAVPVGAAAPRFTVQQASDVVIAAARPVGAAYVEELRALLDPRNGRLDIAPGPNRVNQPGFSTGLVGYPSMFYQGRFSGYIDDIIILAHEAGHAVQNMLMDRQKVLPRYANGPGYFTESFGVFGEMNVLRHLYRTEPDTALKIFYLERLLDQATGLFQNGAEAAFEQALFDSVAVGRRLDADGYETLMQNIGSKYSSTFGPNSERRLWWVQPLQFYTWPLYRLNYVYARALALAYLDKLESNERSFAPRFNQLLSGGYDAPPDAVLRRTVGLSINGNEVVDGSVAVIAKWTKELQALYAR